MVNRNSMGHCAFSGGRVFEVALNLSVREANPRHNPDAFSRERSAQARRTNRPVAARNGGVIPSLSLPAGSSNSTRAR